MRSSCTPLLILAALGAIVALGPGARAQGTPDAFAEAFALATDRAAVLEQLIPGTPEYYYYHCLHAQNTGALDQVPPLLKLWIERHGRGGQVEEIENRQALLAYELDPRGTLDFLRQRLGLGFHHQRHVPGRKPDLPSRLDQGLLSRDTLTRRALDLHRNSLDGFRDPAFEWLAGQDLDDELLMALLQRLPRPDHPNLPALIVRNLDHRNSRGFGSLGIHGRLLLDQLEECVLLRPELLDKDAFVQVYIQRLLPDADTHWQLDAGARQAYLDRLAAFARRLAPAHNSFKAHVLYHRLVHDRALGIHDRDRFMAYLRLPRTSSYANSKYAERHQRRDLVNLGQDYPTQLGRIGDDEALVRAYLTHFFLDESSYQPYAEYVRDTYLKRVFAETRILFGQGDMERWYSMLDDPAYYEALKERVEIEFAPTQPVHYGVGDDVSIDVDLKNVDTLLVKVFEINTLNYYTEQQREVDASINLDGLVANEETTHNYDDNALRRVRRSFSFPSLSRPGVYVVEFIGNGMSSRAVVRKGSLRFTERLGSAGHVLAVHDESGVILPDAAVWLGGRRYGADEQGRIVVPYSTEPGAKPMVLQHGQLAARSTLQHRAESYALQAGIFLDREELTARRTARLLVRPRLLVNDRVASLALLEDVVLTVSATDQDGVVSSQDVRDFELFEDKESVHEIQVPENLAQISVSLRGRVQNLSQAEPVDLRSRSRGFTLNGIDKTALTSCALLGRSEQGYVLDWLGKNGEPRPDRAVTLSFTHRDFTDTVSVTLKTDAAGRILLGALEGIVSLRAASMPGEYGEWVLKPHARTYLSELNGALGQTLRVPYQGEATRATRSAFALLERRGNAWVANRFQHLALADGFLELRDLAVGDYDLWMKQADQQLRVRVTAGQARSDWILGSQRLLPVADADPLQITRVSATPELLEVQLAHAGAETRVHVVATRYLAPFDPFASLLVSPDMGSHEVTVWQARSDYQSGREIGDEYRYILERRYADKFPGNMLRRPGLLLNPWALDETDTAMGVGGGAGGSFGAGRGKASGRGQPEESAPVPFLGLRPGMFPNLEFLPETSVVLANLRPDADGLLAVPLSALGPGQLVHVLAVDGEDSVYATQALAEKRLEPRDRRLILALDPEGHYSEQRRIEFVEAGAATVLEDVSTSSVEVYDSLASVFRLFATLSGSTDLQQFAFLLGWPELPLEEQLELYSRHACHELHFFLHNKDPQFFEQVVRPYLANKMDKTFLDHWLLEQDLSGYLEPWRFARLNVVERILLARRLDGRQQAMARHLAEQLDLIPPDPARTRQLFDTALLGAALDTGDSLGKQVSEARELLQDKARSDLEALGYNGNAPAPMPEAAVALEQEVDGDAREGARSGRARRAGKDDMKFREQLRQLYRAPDRTREYVEHNYWHRRIHEHDAGLITVDPFWRDYAQAPAGQPFVSSHLPEAAGNFAEMMLALSVLDLPFEAGEHVSAMDGNRLTLDAASPLLLVRKEILPAQAAQDGAPILISQGFFRADDRYSYDGNQRQDKFVTDEFLIDVVYGCQVVLTNPSSADRRLELLLQIPRGAIPVQRGFDTRGVSVALGSFSTTTVEYHFYFPRPGQFSHYPAHVSHEGRLLANARPVSMNVLAEPSTVDTASWDYVSQNGTADQVLEYLEGANLDPTELSRIAWRMREREVFDRVLAHLRGRHVFDALLWSYGIYHVDTRSSREYLEQSHDFVTRCGLVLDSPLLTIDPIERRSYQHIEYEPLFNGRAHRWQDGRILNASLARQYQQSLSVLAYVPRLDDTDWLAVTYYLLLQDRVGEAQQTFARVDPDQLPMRLQYDYTRAYMDFFTADHALARGIAEAYQDHPVPRWRARFRDVLNQLDEAAGGAVASADGEDRTQQQTALAASEPALELDVEARAVTLRHANLSETLVSYYKMDIEFLFSTSPFVQQGAGSFAYIRPNRTDTLALDPDQQETRFDLPAEFHSSNVLVEVRGGGLTRRVPYYANTLAVRTMENYGQLKVTHAESGQPLPSVYVKVFARLANGATRFHKDGYTDLRGRFDYASLSGSDGQPVEQYGILVLSEGHGAVIREVQPPLQ